MDAAQAFTSLANDPVRRVRLLDDVLESLNRDEKRRMKRLLNNDPSLITTYRLLPTEIICNIVYFLNLDDIIALHQVQDDSWQDTWFSPTVCNTIIRFHFRVLAFHEKYVGLPEANRRQWLLEELRQYQARKNGIFESKMLIYFKSLLFKCAALQGRYAYYSHGKMVAYDRGIELTDLETNDVAVYQCPDRIQPFHWDMSNEYLVAMYRRPTRFTAWRLDGTMTSIEYHMHCPLKEPMTICRDRVAFSGPFNARLYIWHIGSRLQEIVLSVIDTKDHEIHWTHISVVFHPENVDVLYIFCIKAKTDARISVLKCIGDYEPIHIVTVPFDQSDGILDGNHIWPARLIDFSGTYIVYFTTHGERVTFNVYTEILDLHRTPILWPQIRNRQVWENLQLEDEMIESLITKRFGHFQAVNT